MAKYPTDGSDPYVDPQSGVLLNLLGIVDQAELDNVEGALVAVRVQELAYFRRPAPSISPICRPYIGTYLGTFIPGQGRFGQSTFLKAKRDLPAMSRLRAMRPKSQGRWRANSFSKTWTRRNSANGLATILVN